MKKSVLMIAVCMTATQLFSQTLFTYGPYPVSKEEFLRAYNKNKTAVTDKAASLKEYLELYSKFKIKVKTAQELRLDTIQQMKYDLQNFRSQVEEAYMNDEKQLNILVDEAIQRSQKDIHLLHYSVGINSKMSAADTVKAYKAMQELAEGLKAAATTDTGILQAVSSKYIPVKTRDLGYITAFSLPYEIENLVYRLQPGNVSALYRSKSALQLFRNIGERAAAGKWKVAQILLSIPPDASPSEVKLIGTRADSIYKALMAGADFAALARQFSEDKLTYLNGGEMPEFGTGKFELPFETAVLQLKKDGEISKPVVTDFGYHIVKRLEKRDIPADKSDEPFVYGLRQQIIQDSRIDAEKAGFLRSVMVKTGYKRNAAIKEAELFRYADSITLNSQVRAYPISKKTIFSFAKQQVLGADWLNFVKDYKLNPDVYKGENNKDLLEKYITTTTFEYYRKHLEEFNRDFRYQLQEFREGNMLFEIMERNVWSKAANDSAGLQNYYNQHKANYIWPASAAILLFNCSDRKVAEQAAAALGQGKNWRQIAEESEGKVQCDSGRYELSQLQLPPGTQPAEGLVSAPLVNSGDNTTSFLKLLTLFPASQQRSFEEAKGLVINDYQGYLEGKWVEELKKKYPVKVNEPVFQSMLR